MTTHKTITVGRQKRLALVAHDNQTPDLLEWARFNRGRLREHALYATGTTGRYPARRSRTLVWQLGLSPVAGSAHMWRRLNRRRR